MLPSVRGRILMNDANLDLDPLFFPCVAILLLLIPMVFEFPFNLTF